MPETKPGQLHYVALDGITNHWPGPDPWQAKGSSPSLEVPALDLFQLRIQCILTLRKVEDELDRRGLLQRATNTDYKEK